MHISDNYVDMNMGTVATEHPGKVRDRNHFPQMFTSVQANRDFISAGRRNLITISILFGSFPFPLDRYFINKGDFEEEEERGFFWVNLRKKYLYYFLGCSKSIPQTGCLKQQKSIVSQSWRLKV